jgi:hypothetical protein
MAGNLDMVVLDAELKKIQAGRDQLSTGNPTTGQWPDVTQN